MTTENQLYMPVTSPGEGEDWFSIEINRSLCGLCRAGGIECNQLRGQHHHHKQWQKNGNKNGQPRKLIYWITQVIHRVIAKLYLWIIIEINVWINRGDLWWAINWKFSQSFYYLSPPFYTLVILDFSQKCILNVCKESRLLRDLRLDDTWDKSDNLNVSQYIDQAHAIMQPDLQNMQSILIFVRWVKYFCHYMLQTHFDKRWQFSSSSASNRKKRQVRKLSSEFR